MTASRNHHYLPQFYLRGFRSSGTRKKSQKVWTICKTPSADCREALIKDVAFEEHFHTVTKLDGTLDSDSLEHQIAKLEAVYSPVRDKLLAGSPIDATERHLLSRFVCLMKMRSPAEKAAIEIQLSAMANALMWSLAVDNRIETTFPDLPMIDRLPAPAKAELARRIRKAITARRATFTHSNAALLRPMFTTAFDSRLVAIYDKMALEVLRAPIGSVFVTGDQPVTFFDATPPRSSKLGTGLICSAIEVTFPLSAEKLLRFSWKHPSGERLIFPEEVDEFNRRVIIMATRYVFASRCDDAILKLIRENHAHTAGSAFTAARLPHGQTLSLSRTIPVRPAEFYQ